MGVVVVFDLDSIQKTMWFLKSVFPVLQLTIYHVGWGGCFDLSLL